MARSRTEQATTRHVAFLRGINVGGRRVTMAQLCAAFEALGFAEVGTFLASGNVTFSTPDPPRARGADRGGAADGARVRRRRVRPAQPTSSHRWRRSSRSLPR
jgi:hypothetical protein